MSKLGYILEEVLLESRRKDTVERYREVLQDSFMGSPVTIGGTETESFDDVLKWVENEIPHPKYLEYVLNSMCCGGYGVEPEYIMGLIKNFHRLSEKGFIENKDIYSKEYATPEESSFVDLSSLKQVVEEGMDIESKKQIDKTLKKDRDIIYDGPRWMVIVPKSREASCHYGAGTKWCTTSKVENAFESYIKQGILYYLIDKTKKQDDDDVMYKIAIYLKYENDSIGIKAMPFEQSIRMFDTNDTQINFKHIIPLLPVELINSIKKYYHNYVVFDREKEEKDKSDSLIASLMEHNFFNAFKDKFYTTLSENSIYNLVGGFEEFESQDNDGHGSIWFNFKNNDEIYSIYCLGGQQMTGIPQLYEVFGHTSDGEEFYFTEVLLEAQWVWWNLLRVSTMPSSLSSVEVDNLISILVNRIIYILKWVVWGRLTDKKDNEGNVFWKPLNSASSFIFKYPPKEGSLTHEFIKAVKENPGTTPKEFYREKYDFDYKPGYNTQFFGSVKDSGILRAEKGPYGELKYYLGPNYEDWTKGKLKRFK